MKIKREIEPDERTASNVRILTKHCTRTGLRLHSGASKSVRNILSVRTEQDSFVPRSKGIAKIKIQKPYRAIWYEDSYERCAESITNARRKVVSTHRWTITIFIVYIRIRILFKHFSLLSMKVSLKFEHRVSRGSLARRRRATSR